MKHHSRITLVAACSALLLALGCSDKKMEPEEEHKGGIYVLNQGDDKVAIYDWHTLEFVTDFDAMVDEPHHMEMTRNHEFMFVVGRHVPGQIAKFDMETNDFMDRADGPSTLFPTAVAVSPDGNTGYVTDFTQSSGGMYKLDLTTMNFSGDSAKSSATQLTHDIKMSATGDFLVFCNYGTDNVVVFDLAGDSIKNIVDVGTPWSGTSIYGPYGLAIDNDSLVYIACRKSREVRVLDLSSMTIIDSIDIPITEHNPDPFLSGPTLLQISPAGSRLYISTYYGNSLVVIDLSTASRPVVANIPVGALSFGIATTDNGSTIYVACANEAAAAPGHIYVVNATNNTVQDSITAGMRPFMVHFHEPHEGHH
jgi:YVTN family beta-propeller protein